MMSNPWLSGTFGYMILIAIGIVFVLAVLGAYFLGKRKKI